AAGDALNRLVDRRVYRRAVLGRDVLVRRTENDPARIVDLGLNPAVFALQVLVVLQFEPLEPLAVDAGDADQMRDERAARVQALAFLRRLDAGQLAFADELFDHDRLLGRDLALYVYKTLTLRQLREHGLVVEIERLTEQRCH